MESKGHAKSGSFVSDERLRSCQYNILGRIFAIDLLIMANGCFISVSEASSPRIGAITLSIKSERGVTSSNLIPDKRGSLFAGMLGEMLAEKTNGIAVTSLYLREELDSDSMKTLLNEVRKLMQRD